MDRGGATVTRWAIGRLGWAVSQAHNRATSSRLTALNLGACAAAALASASTPATVTAQGPTPYPGGRWQPPPATYGTKEVDTTLTMDDGVVLQVLIGYPADPASGNRASGRFPVIVQHMPYSADLSKTPPAPGISTGTFFIQRGWIFAVVHVRGTGAATGTGSGGRITLGGSRDMADAPRIIDWAAGRPTGSPPQPGLDGSDGRVALYGCSWPAAHAVGDTAAVGPGSPLKATAAQCTGVPPKSWYGEVTTPQGIPGPFWKLAPNLCHFVGDQPQTCTDFVNLTNSVLSGGPEAYYGTYWKDKDVDPAKIVRNGVPLLMWEGWQDIDQKGVFEQYAGLQNAAAGRPAAAPMPPGPADPRWQVIYGDWGHAGGLDDGIVLEWFETWVKGVDTGMQSTDTPLHMYDRGAKQWVNAAAYPGTLGYTTYFLGDGGRLAATPPTAAGTDSLSWNDPTTTRTYTTPPLPAGATLAGPMAASLYASSSNTNLELVATVSDIAPDGTVASITANSPFLGSQRAIDPTLSWSDSTGTMIRPWLVNARDDYLTAGQVYRFDVEIWPNLFTVLPGHSLRLTLASQTPQQTCQGEILGAQACELTVPQATTLPGGTYALARGASTPSRLAVPLVPLGSYPSAASGVTPTSNNVALPLDWGRLGSSASAPSAPPPAAGAAPPPTATAAAPPAMLLPSTGRAGGAAPAMLLPLVIGGVMLWARRARRRSRRARS